MLMRLLSSGLAAGVIAGICVAGIQSVTTTPLILKAEVYERAAEEHHHSALELPRWRSPSGAAIVLAHDHPAPAATATPASDTDVSRTVLTTTATVGAAVGFALMLLAVMQASGAVITPQTAAIWGAAGFVVTGLAPALGLAPELPGSMAADLNARQIWWVMTAVMAAGGMWSIWRWQTVAAVLGGIALLVIPHVWGVPDVSEFGSTVPAELASRFTAASLAVHAILWVLIGALAGWFWQRQADPLAA